MRKVLLLKITLFLAFALHAGAAPLVLEKDSSVVLIGGGFGSRMMNYGHFETELHSRYPGHNLIIRNMCDEGHTPAFRPHSARPIPYAFEGAEKYYPLSKTKDRWRSGHSGSGTYPSPDAWLGELKPDIIIGFFGYTESFKGPEGLAAFKDELGDLIGHLATNTYNGEKAPELALVSPAAFQDLSAVYGTPDGKEQNANLKAYTEAMKEVAAESGVHLVDLFSPTSAWFSKKTGPLTRDGALWTDEGYSKIAPLLADGLFGSQKAARVKRDDLNALVLQKNWMWRNYYKIPNGVHVHGRRHRPHGPGNYPYELKKLSKMVAARDLATWAFLAGEPFDLAEADSGTGDLPDVKSNRKEVPPFVDPEKAVETIDVPEGYKLNLFADEVRFPELANPVQMAFDNKGRLWVATMPSYPHYRPGDALPDDKLLIFEDTNQDGVADKQIVFADGLHLPMGFEIAHDGVYVSQGYMLEFLQDTDGDDKADVREVVMAGFDDHDTHHAISAFCADPSGAFLMGEGTFLHSNVETAYGTVRSSNGGFFRYNPARRHLERVARLSIPNPWGIAYDHWGQDFFADTSGPDVRWMLPGSVKVPYGSFAPLPKNLLKVRVRPTSGLEFVSSRHFPDEVQGDILISNNIGFQGTKQHSMVDKGTGFESAFRHDLLKSTDRNFRPVDMEFAPDGSLYVVDWHNQLIGHMQHSARDPFRDHAHGRVYRVTYPSRPLVKAPKIAGASIPQLLENLKLPEYRARYRTRRELRGRDTDDVLKATRKWVKGLDRSDTDYEHHLVEALWVIWGHNRMDPELLETVLTAKDPRTRSVGVRAIRYNAHLIAGYLNLLKRAAADADGRVRLEAIIAGSHLGSSEGLSVLNIAKGMGIDEWIKPPLETGVVNLKGKAVAAPAPEATYTTTLTGAAKDQFKKGVEVFTRDGYCGTCHQPDGKGLEAAGFPPLAGSEWVTGSEERLIKLALHGLMGPITVKGKSYPGTVPMAPFKQMLNDEEMAAVLTFVRNAFGNKAAPVAAAKVAEVRAATKARDVFYTADELLKQHP